ncbi:MAG: hypothetical protein HYX89_06360 [Chloroflexi bacterium]|nr:hypothetical protein [Chloroflexota bacterium]
MEEPEPFELADLIEMQVRGDGTSRVFERPHRLVVVTAYRASRSHIAKVVVAEEKTHQILDRRRFKSLRDAVVFVNRAIRYASG